MYKLTYQFFLSSAFFSLKPVREFPIYLPWMLLRFSTYSKISWFPISHKNKIKLFGLAWKITCILYSSFAKLFPFFLFFLFPFFKWIPLVVHPNWTIFFLYTLTNLMTNPTMDGYILGWLGLTPNSTQSFEFVCNMTWLPLTSYQVDMRNKQQYIKGKIYSHPSTVHVDFAPDCRPTCQHRVRVND